MVHRRVTDGREIVLGNQGDLFGNAMTWWDHDTGSVWSQPRAEAILGPRRGERLDALPVTLTTWEAWRAAYPHTQALDVAGWDTGFHLEDMAVVVDLGSEAVAYLIPPLREAGAVNDTVAGVEIAVAIDPAAPERWAVFGRTLETGEVVRLSATAAGLVDEMTGTTFDAFTGVATAGPLEGTTLPRLPAFTSFPEDFWTFFPSGRLWPPG